MRTRGTGSQTTTGAMISSVAKKTRNAPAMGLSRTCSNEWSGEDKCGNSTSTTEGKVGPIQPTYHGYE